MFWTVFGLGLIPFENLLHSLPSLLISFQSKSDQKSDLWPQIWLSLLMTLRIHEHGLFENIRQSMSVYTLSEPFLSVLNPQGVGSLSKLNIQPKYSCAINNKNQSSDWCSEFTGQSSCDLNHQETCSSTEIEYCHRNDIPFNLCSVHILSHVERFN